MTTVATLPIQGTFDIAMARNMLRRMAQSYNWQPHFRARAAAALSALAELGLFAQHANFTVFYLTVDVVTDDTREGVMFSCEIHTSGQYANYMNYARLQLERAADDIQIEQTSSGEKVSVYVWIQ